MRVAPGHSSESVRRPWRVSIGGPERAGGSDGGEQLVDGGVEIGGEPVGVRERLAVGVEAEARVQPDRRTPIESACWSASGTTGKIACTRHPSRYTGSRGPGMKETATLYMRGLATRARRAGAPAAAESACEGARGLGPAPSFRRLRVWSWLHAPCSRATGSGSSHGSDEEHERDLVAEARRPSLADVDGHHRLEGARALARAARHARASPPAATASTTSLIGRPGALDRRRSSRATHACQAAVRRARPVERAAAGRAAARRARATRTCRARRAARASARGASHELSA